MMSEDMSRAAWLRSEITLVRELRNHVSPLGDEANFGILRSRCLSLDADLAGLAAELSVLDSGGRIDVRLTGEAVKGTLIDAVALAEVMQPLKRLVEQLHTEAFVSSRDGSFVLEIVPAPQQQLGDMAPRIDPIGELLSDVVDAGASPDVDGAVARAVDELSLDSVRAVTQLVASFCSNQLHAHVCWTNSSGRVRAGGLDMSRSGIVRQALQRTEESRSQYEVTGELRGLTLEGRRTFQIRADGGQLVTGHVAKDAAPTAVGFRIGEHVVAGVEETDRRRLAAQGSTTSRRLTSIRHA